jgi:hypothetical protein
MKIEMKLNSIVKLIIPPSDGSARIGARARIVDGEKEFSELYKQLVDQIDDRYVSDFICVRWDRRDLRSGNQDDGFYNIARFAVIDDRENIEPLNNDGRSNCWWCGADTVKKPSFNHVWNICVRCNR